MHSAARHGWLGAQWSQCEKNLSATQSNSKDLSRGAGGVSLGVSLNAQCPGVLTSRAGNASAQAESRCALLYVLILFEPSVSQVI